MIVDISYKHIKRDNKSPILVYKKDNKDVIFFYNVENDWENIIGFKYSAFVMEKNSEYGKPVYNDSLKDLIWECFKVLNDFKYELDKELFKLYFENGDVYTEKQ